LPERIFVERELTARKGKRRAKLHLRVFAPIPHGNDYACSFELTVDGKPSWVPERIYGFDGLQAFALAMQFAAWQLLQLEAERGMRIDASDWMNIIEYAADAPLSTYDRDRIVEIKAELREQARTYREDDERKRKPRAAADRRSSRSRGGTRAR
jgi:hypothetical protein